MPVHLTPAQNKQVGRFVRLFVATLVPQLVAVQGHVGRSVVFAAVVGSAEVAFRAVWPS